MIKLRVYCQRRGQYRNPGGTMKLYPAIDIKDGHCVRLRQGSFLDVKKYFDNPVDAAKKWADEGAKFLHIVDLDGALKGEPVNAELIKTICNEVKIPIQIGGGIRSLDSIEALLKSGVKRCIIGTRALKEPEFVLHTIKEFGDESVAVGIDAKCGMVATHGWENVSQIKATSLALKMKEIGVKHIVFTDIGRDGMLSGVNVSATADLTRMTGIEIIASGGVGSMDDLKFLDEAGVKGAIIGKALYEGRISLKDAVETFEQTDNVGGRNQ